MFKSEIHNVAFKQISRLFAGDDYRGDEICNCSYCEEMRPYLPTQAFANFGVSLVSEKGLMPSDQCYIVRRRSLSNNMHSILDCDPVIITSVSVLNFYSLTLRSLYFLIISVSLLRI